MKAIIVLCCSLLHLLSYQPLIAVQYDSIKILVKDRAITNNEIEIRAFEMARARAGRQPSAETINDTQFDSRGMFVADANARL